MTEWRETTLGDVLTFQRGFDLTERESTPGPYPVISSGGISYWTDVAKVDGPGVVTGRKGVLGKVHFSLGPYWPHDTTLWVKDFKDNNPRFVYYMLQCLPLAALDAGASNPTLNRNHAHLLPVRVPPVELQGRISDVLGTIDDLIENNRRRVDLLEEMARAIYQEWFVRFRYPGHEDLPLIDSPHSPTPDGWTTSRLRDLVTTRYGYTESAATEPIGPHFLRGMDINKRSYIDWATVPYCAIDEGERRKYEVQRGDVFVIRMADPGKVGICEIDVDAVFASYLVRLRPIDDRIDPYFLFFTLCDEAYQAWVTGASSGATRKSASAKVMTEPFVVVPSPGHQALFRSRVEPLRSELSALVEQNSRLAAMRALLIPKLVSGAIDVSSLDLELAGATT